MKFHFPIEVCMEDFIKNGKFDCIQIGQSKEWILNNFPDPDGYFSMSYKDSIWKYGTIEFHFRDRSNITSAKSDSKTAWTVRIFESEAEVIFEPTLSESQLFMIFCEQLSLPDENGIKINKWIFDKLPLTMLECIRILNDERLSFSLSHSKYGEGAGITILNSGVCLIFHDEGIENSNNFRLLGFSKSS